MQEERVVISSGSIARLAGLFYLAYIVTFAAATFLRPSVSWTDASMAVHTIQTAERMFRVADMLVWIADLFFLMTAWALYVLFEPVNRGIALLFLLLNLVGVCVESVFTLVDFAALLLANGAPFLRTFQPEQLHSLALLFLKISGSAKVTTLFYGAWLFPLGYLVVKSRMVPKILGVLLFLDGSALLICFVQLNIFPGYEKWMYPLYPIMLIAELGLGLWLAIKGVKVVN